MLNQRKKLNMNANTKVLLLGVVITSFAFSSFAAEPLLSPRAKGNQIKVASSSVETPAIVINYVDTTPALLSPRAQGNQVKVVKSTNTDVIAALVCQKTMLGSPKAVAECSSHSNMPGCQTLASASPAQ